MHDGDDSDLEAAYQHASSSRRARGGDGGGGSGNGGRSGAGGGRDGGGRGRRGGCNGRSEQQLQELDPKRVKRIIANRMSAQRSKVGDEAGAWAAGGLAHGGGGVHSTTARRPALRPSLAAGNPTPHT
jgi:hypothetical protein